MLYAHAFICWLTLKHLLMQGSHVTGQSGSYILQWKYFDSAKASFDFPLSSHKSKVMYYTELLPSEAFR